MIKPVGTAARLGLCVMVFGASLSSVASAVWIDLNISSHFNADGIGNNAAGTENTSVGGNDIAMNTIDAGSGSMQGLLTQTVASFSNGKGLPDDGFFSSTEPTNQLGYDVQLTYRNSDNGNNVWRYLHQGNNATVTTGEGEVANPVGGPNPFEFTLMAGQQSNYQKLNIYAISTRGASAINVTLNYSDSSTENFASRLVPDFGTEPGNALYPENYTDVTGHELADLIDGMGRLNGINVTTGAFTRTGAERAVFALGFPVNISKTLESFTIEYTGEVTAVDGATGALTVADEGTPGATSGLVVLGASANAPSRAKLVVNRQTGVAEIHAIEDATFIGYEVFSPSSQGIDDSAWTSITSTNADLNDTWTELSAAGAKDTLAEADLAATGANDGFTLNAGEIYSLGSIWNALPVHLEDLLFEMLDENGMKIGDAVEYVGDEIPLGDYDGNGSVGPEDWPMFREGLGGNYAGLTAAQAYLNGDLDGDFDSDLQDFRIFVELAGGMAALFGTATAVPEPASWAMLLGLGVTLIAARRLRGSRRVLAATSAVVIVSAATCSSSHAQTFTTVGSNPPTISHPGDIDGDRVPPNLFDDTYLNGPGINQSQNGLFETDYDDNTTTGGLDLEEYAGDGAGPQVMFMDYGSSISTNWIAFAGRTGGNPLADRVGMLEFWFDDDDFVDTLPEGPADAVVTIGPDDPRLLGSVLRPYTLAGTHTGQYVALRMTISEVSVGLPTNNIGGHELRFLSGPSDVVLEINRETGAMTLRNNGASAQNIEMQAISIQSEGGGLMPSGFNGVGGDSGAFPLGNGSGNGWEVGGGSNPSRIIEAFYLGESVLAAGTAGLSLGAGYNALLATEDVTFRWENSLGNLFDGVVTYVGTSAEILAGDYNNDGTVDAADYTVWRNNLGASVVLDNDVTPGTVDASDYVVWKNNFGEMLGGGALLGAATSVPEPASLSTLLLIAATLTVRFLRKRSSL